MHLIIVSVTAPQVFRNATICTATLKDVFQRITSLKNNEMKLKKLSQRSWNLLRPWTIKQPNRALLVNLWQNSKLMTNSSFPMALVSIRLSRRKQRLLMGKSSQIMSLWTNLLASWATWTIAMPLPVISTSLSLKDLAIITSWLVVVS